MTDRDALLRAILDRPDDDTARLVYADKLDDLGGAANAALAEFIRLQMKLAAGDPAVQEPGDFSLWHGEKAALEARQHALLKKWGAKWLPNVARLDVDMYGLNVRGAAVEFRAAEFVSTYRFERGFLAAIEIDCRIREPRWDVLGELVRDAMAHRPLQRVRVQVYRRFAPTLALALGPCDVPGRTDWQARLVLDEDRPGPQYITHSRAALVAGLPKWLAEETEEIEFEETTEHDGDELPPGDPIPF